MSKKTLNTYKFLSNGNMSTNITSEVTCIQFMDNIGVQINVLTGTPSGTFSIEVSADHKAPFPNQNTTSTGNWTTVVSATITSGSPAQTYFNLTLLSAPYIRLVYTANTGAGTCEAYIVGKEI